MDDANRASNPSRHYFNVIDEPLPSAARASLRSPCQMPIGDAEPIRLAA
jgi:hypothetical protein